MMVAITTFQGYHNRDHTITRRYTVKTLSHKCESNLSFEGMRGELLNVMYQAQIKNKNNNNDNDKNKNNNNNIK